MPEEEEEDDEAEAAAGSGSESGATGGDGASDSASSANTGELAATSVSERSATLPRFLDMTEVLEHADTHERDGSAGREGARERERQGAAA